MAGLPSVLGNHRSRHAIYVQSARKGQAHTCDGIAKGDPDQRIASRLVVEVRAGIRRANNTHRNLQRAVQVGVRLARWLLMADDIFTNGDELGVPLKRPPK
jgi:hypothetical protein